jgi:UPF0716 protein FxsA
LLDTIFLLIVVGVVGAWLVRREGLGVARRLQRTVLAGGVPAAELVDAFLIVLAGALMLAPGFVTDVLALGLLIPPVRAVVRRALSRRFRPGLAGSGLIDV